MNAALLSQLRDKAQQRIKANMFGQLEESDRQLRAIGEEITKKLGCRAIYGKIKSEERMLQKVQGDYKGDWYELKDAVRMTIVAPNQNKLNLVYNEVGRQCRGHRGLGLIKHEMQTREQTACGYSGMNSVVRFTNGQPGEIQANVPEMMYGQMSREVFCATIGTHEFWRIKSRFIIEGGLGHVFYEVYRVAPTTENGKWAKRVSILYFDYLRGLPNYQRQRELEIELNAFKKANLHAFMHH